MFYDSGTQELGETTETFMKSLIGEMAWDFMNVDNIIEWYQVAEDTLILQNSLFWKER